MGGLSVGGLSLATCSVLHTARLLHAQGIGVGGRASVYGESQGSGNGSIYLAAASFSRVFTFYILIQLLTPWEAKSKCKSAIFCRIFPSALGRTWPAITTDQCRGETEFVTKISRVGHQQRSPAGFFLQLPAADGCLGPNTRNFTFPRLLLPVTVTTEEPNGGMCFLGFRPVREREPVSAALTHWALTRGLWRLLHQECPLPAQHSPPPPDSWSAPLQRRAPQENGLVLSKNQGREIQMKKNGKHSLKETQPALAAGAR